MKLASLIVPWKMAALVLGTWMLSNCGAMMRDTHNRVLVSVQDQKLLLVRDNKPVKAYKISTSKFGTGSEGNTYYTPLGRMEIAKKIGDGHPPGMVFKSRRPTGEVLKPNAPGRDPVVGRIMWLRGLENHNRNTMARYIYIHGTPEEWRLGTPASFGCIRMSMRDVVDLYNRVGEGAAVRVMRGSLLATAEGREYAARHGAQMKAKLALNMR